MLTLDRATGDVGGFCGDGAFAAGTVDVVVDVVGDTAADFWVDVGLDGAWTKSASKYGFT